MVYIIAAMGTGRVIGSKRGLPWHYPEEYRQFLDQVRGKTMIMGRISWEIFSADLPETRFVVVSSEMKPSEGILTASSVREAIDIASEFPEDIFIAGGAGVYKDGIKFADRMHLSFIKGKYEGDRFFPEFRSEDWEILSREERPDYIYVEYGRRNPQVMPS